MRLMIFLTSILLCYMSTVAADPDMGTANYLLRVCKQDLAFTDGQRSPDTITTREMYESAYCLGYINGFRNGMTLGAAEFDTNCMPDEVTLLQAERVVVKYLENHPEKLNIKAGLLTAEALHAAWPCKK